MSGVEKEKATAVNHEWHTQALAAPSAANAQLRAVVDRVEYIAADLPAADGTGTRTDGTQIAFTEARMKSVLSSIWTNGGKRGTIMTGAFNKRDVENVARIIKR